MGKVAEAGDSPKRGGGELAKERVLELGQLVLWQGVQEALKDDHGFAQGGIEVIVGGVEGFPILVGVGGSAFGQILDGGAKVRAEVFDELDEATEFVEELHFTGENDLAEEAVEQCDALAAGDKKIVRIEGLEVGDGTEMFGMSEHGAE